MTQMEILPNPSVAAEDETRMKQALPKHFGTGGADLIRRDVYGGGK